MRFHEKPPPASDADLKSWEAFFTQKMPKDLRELFLESNGPVLYRDDIQKELQMFGASEAPEFYKDYCFDQYLPDCIPICLDGSGVFAVYRLCEGVISDIWAIESGVLTWDEAARLCSDLQGLIDLEHPIENAIRERQRNFAPKGYDEGVDMNAIERLSLVESICRRPGIYTSGGKLCEILALMDGYEIATRSAFGDHVIPEHYDISPIDAMDFISKAVGFERSGKPIHLELERIIDHFGSEDAVINAMKANSEKVRKVYENSQKRGSRRNR